MSAALDSLVRENLPRVVAMAPAGIDEYGIRVQARDRVSREGYRWAAPGEWSHAPGEVLAGEVCATARTGGIHVARQWSGTYSVVPVDRISVVGWSHGDVYGSSADKVRLSRAWVGALLTIPAALRVLYGAYLRGANLRGADLRGAYLRGADLSWAYLRGADLSGADLRGADLRGAYLRGAYLRGADLSGADLRGADLRGADLSGADLSGADLRWANLSGANLRWANLSGANLRWANLSEADLRWARGVPDWARQAAEVTS